MIHQTMVKGTMIVRATKVPIENSSDYYLEFQFNETQVQQFIAELLLEHHKNNTLTVVHKHAGEKETIIESLKEILEKNPDMPQDSKQEYFKRILELSSMNGGGN